MAVPEKLMNVLACPECKGNVYETKRFITCKNCKKAYPVLDSSVPDMLIEDSWDLSKAEKSGFMHKSKL